MRSGPRPARPKNKARLQRYEEMAAEAEKTRKLDFEEIQIPTRRVWATWWWRQTTSTRVSTAASSRICRSRCAQRHRRRIGPNGVGKTTLLFKTIVGLEGLTDSGKGNGRWARRSSSATSIRAGPTSIPRRHGVGGRLRRPGTHRGRPERDAPRALMECLRLQGP